MKKSLNFDNADFFQDGSVMILLLVFIAFAILLGIGTLSISEWNSAVIESRNHTQQTANAAAFTYGRSYLKYVEACITEEITTQLEHVGTPEFEQCRIEGLEECVASEFEDCAVDLKSCWPNEDESPLKTCPQNSEVKEKANRDAQIATQEMIEYSDLISSGWQIQNDIITVSTRGVQHSTLPQLGKSGSIDSYASSRVQIKQHP